MLSSLVSDEAQERVRYFVDDVFLPRAVTVSPSVPAAMVNGPPDASGWIPWKPVPSPVADHDILALEERIGDALPPAFRGWLMYKCLLMTDFGLLTLPETPCDVPLEDFVGHLDAMDSQPYFSSRNIIPFAHDGNDVGPLCFDLSRRRADGDCPVRLYDHELLPDTTYNGEPFADSFDALLCTIATDMLSYDR